jgi:glutamate-1-semialdehyde 2,1-aminomutase
VPPQAGETVLVAPFNDAAAAVATIDRHAHELAAVIVEPLQRVLKPEPGFLEAVREATRRHGIVLVYDEIVTGFRIAWGGAQEKYGVVPDIACYGKAVSGGFPLAAIAGRADVMSVLDARSRPRADVVWATNTLNGNPVCAAAGCAALDVLSKPASTTASRGSVRGFAPASSNAARDTALRCRRRGRMPCSACASPIDGHSRRGWT